MYFDVLSSLGLSPNEAKVYESLLNIGKAPINEIALESNVHRRNVYDSTEKLLKKGLVSEEFDSGKRFFKPVSPERLVSILKEKETAVDSILPGLQKKFAKSVAKEEAVMYAGIEGVKTYLQDILNVGEPAYFIGAKAFWLDPRLQYFLPKFEKQRVKKRIHLKHIFDHEVRSLAPGILKLKFNDYRFFPPEFSSSTAIDIFGDRVVSFYGLSPGKLPEEPVQFTIVSEKIAEGYRKFFEFMWKGCKK